MSYILWTGLTTIICCHPWYWYSTNDHAIIIHCHPFYRNLFPSMNWTYSCWLVILGTYTTCYIVHYSSPVLTGYQIYRNLCLNPYGPVMVSHPYDWYNHHCNHIRNPFRRIDISQQIVGICFQANRFYQVSWM